MNIEIKTISDKMDAEEQEFLNVKIQSKVTRQNTVLLFLCSWQHQVYIIQQCSVVRKLRKLKQNHSKIKDHNNQSRSAHKRYKLLDSIFHHSSLYADKVGPG